MAVTNNDIPRRNTPTLTLLFAAVAVTSAAMVVAPQYGSGLATVTVATASATHPIIDTEPAYVVNIGHCAGMGLNIGPSMSE